MEQYANSKNKVQHHIRVADHLLTMTYPMLKDPKILASALENMFSALSITLDAVMYYERLFKRVPLYNDNFQSKFTIFKTKVVNNYNISSDTVKFISELKEYVTERKKAPVEFPRKGKYVIADKDYRLRTLAFEDLKKKLTKTKKVTFELLELVEKNDGILRRR